MVVDQLAAESVARPPDASGLGSRCERLRRVLAQASDAEIRLWLIVGERALADRRLAASRRAAAAEQVDVCRALLDARRDDLALAAGKASAEARWEATLVAAGCE